jgi:hypothetical protein
MNQRSVALAAVAILLCCSGSLRADEPIPASHPLFPIERVEQKELVVESVYAYQVQYYRQPLRVKTTKRGESRFDTPEDAFISLTSAMKAIDIDWVLDCWDLESRKKQEKYLDDAVMAQTVRQGWKDLFSTADFILLRRVDRGNVVVLDYVARKSNSEEFRSTLSFRLENGHWKATSINRSDPVANNLSLDKERIRIYEE